MCPFRWSKAIHRVDLLVSATQHLFSLPHLTWRPAVASYICATHIFPVFELFVALEEDPQLLAIASAGGSVVGGAAVPLGEAMAGSDQTLAARVHSKQTQVRNFAQRFHFVTHSFTETMNYQ